MRNCILLASATSLLTATIALAAPQQTHSKRFNHYTVHTERSLTPPGWSPRASPEHASSAHDRRQAAGFDNILLPLRINLAQNNVEEAADHLMDTSHPESPNYSQHLTPEEIAQLFAPSDEAVDDVLTWLTDAGLDVSREANYDYFKGAITVTIPVSHAEDLLKTNYEIYEHGALGTPHVACTSYSVPSSIAHHIDFITPTTDFDIYIPSTRDAKRAIAATSALARGLFDRPKVDPEHDPHIADDTSICDKEITPKCIRELYGINYSPTKNMPNGLGVVRFTPESYIPADLDKFFNKLAPKLAGSRPTMKSIDGGKLMTDSADRKFKNNGESDLDLEYAMALVGPHQTVDLYQTGDSVVGATLNTFLDAFDSSYCSHNDATIDPSYPDSKAGGYKGNSCGVYKNKRPKVLFTSYSYDELQLSPAYERRQCHEYMKLSLSGTTFVFASGDYGVAGNNGKCIDVKNEKFSDSGTMFNPTFPATCPWVLVVGATEVKPGKKITDPESAAIHSGGGFSNNFKMPNYQKTAVEKYFAKHKPSYTSSQYNDSKKTRGYPDISANGVNYLVAVDSAFRTIDSTSASAAAVAAMFALINNERHANGKKPIGFINHALYAHPEMFHDITRGRNKGCGTKGFEAVSGWDPVTGLGTPKFKKLMKYFSNLP
ncbi:subtilisin-like protein [Clavulina sp. PMI_390]|nr:subtilisin-like protein [Clavulina sp. PMI_390]